MADRVYVYAARVPEFHFETRITFEPWLRSYVTQRAIAPRAADIDVNQIFFTNVFLSRIDWWLGADVQHFLDDVDRTGNIYHRRWGDAPLQTAALQLYCAPEKLVRDSSIEYMHGSTGDEIRNGTRAADLVLSVDETLKRLVHKLMIGCHAPCVVANRLNLTGAPFFSLVDATHALWDTMDRLVPKKLHALPDSDHQHVPPWYQYKAWDAALVVQFDLLNRSGPLPPDTVVGEARDRAFLRLISNRLAEADNVTGRENMQEALVYLYHVDCCRDWPESVAEAVLRRILDEPTKKKRSPHKKFLPDFRWPANRGRPRRKRTARGAGSPPGDMNA
eukprot:614592-Prymnesium_polylepis.1